MSNLSVLCSTQQPGILSQTIFFIFREQNTQPTFPYCTGLTITREGTFCCLSTVWFLMEVNLNEGYTRYCWDLEKRQTHTNRHIEQVRMVTLAITKVQILDKKTDSQESNSPRYSSSFIAFYFIFFFVIWLIMGALCTLGCHLIVTIVLDLILLKILIQVKI